MEPLFPEIDFATDELPNLHEIIAKIRGSQRVAPVRYHGVTTWLITGHKELVEAFADEEHFQSAAMYTLHSEPVMGKTIQCMSGGQHRVNPSLLCARRQTACPSSTRRRACSTASTASC